MARVYDNEFIPVLMIRIAAIPFKFDQTFKISGHHKIASVQLAS